MPDFEIGDTVSFLRLGGKHYGQILSMTDSTVTLKIIKDNDDDMTDEITLPITAALPTPKVTVGKKFLRQFARMEVTLADGSMVGEKYSSMKIVGKYAMCLDDLLSAMTNCLVKSSGFIIREWIVPLQKFVGSKQIGFISQDEEAEKYRFLPKDTDFMKDLLFHLAKTVLHWNSMNDSGIDERNSRISGLIDACRKYIEMRCVNVPQRSYDTAIKENYLSQMEPMVEDNLKISDQELELYVVWAKELCDNCVPAGMKAVAYSSYGGSRAFPCDYRLCYDLLLKLVQVNPDPVYYNTLGYIEYYGRCGQRNYTNAFQFFSLGALGGIYESIYKLSDMLMDGLGCIKNEKMAVSLTAGIYRSNRQLFLQGHSDCKLADVALRMAAFFKLGKGCKPNMNMAYRLLLEAQCAIKKRMQDITYPGDKNVFARIQNGIAEVLPETDYSKPVSTLSFDSMEKLFADSFPEGSRLKLVITSSKTGKSASGKISIDTPKGKQLLPMMINCPESHFCELKDYQNVSFVNIESITVGEDSGPFLRKTVIFDQISGHNLIYHGKLAATLNCRVSVTFK